MPKIGLVSACYPPLVEIMIFVCIDYVPFKIKGNEICYLVLFQVDEHRVISVPYPAMEVFSALYIFYKLIH